MFRERPSHDGSDDIGYAVDGGHKASEDGPYFRSCDDGQDGITARSDPRTTDAGNRAADDENGT